MKIFVVVAAFVASATLVLPTVSQGQGGAVQVAANDFRELSA